MSSKGRDMEGIPSVSVGESDIGSEFDEQFDEFQVSLQTSQMKGCLALRVVYIHVDFPNIQDFFQLSRVAVFNGLEESLLVRYLRLRQTHGGDVCGSGWARTGQPGTSCSVQTLPLYWQRGRSHGFLTAASHSSAIQRSDGLPGTVTLPQQRKYKRDPTHTWTFYTSSTRPTLKACGYVLAGCDRTVMHWRLSKSNPQVNA